MARGLTRVGIVLVFGGAGVLLWRVVLAGMPSTYDGGRTLTVPAQDDHDLAGALGTTLGSVALALVVGVVVGLGLAGLRAVLGSAESGASEAGTSESGSPRFGAGRVVGALGWLVGALWTPPVPVAIGGVVLLAVFPMTEGGWTAILVVMLGGVVALLVASAVGERWRRRAWLPGAAAGAVAVGRSLTVLAGAVGVVELVARQDGIGVLLHNALGSRDPYLVTRCCTVFLVIALVGQVLAALAGVWLDRVEPAAPPPRPPATPARLPATPAGPPFAAPGAPPVRAALGRSVSGTVLGIGALTTLVLPVLVFLGSLLAANTHHVGLVSGHPLGTDNLGRDVLAQLLLGYRRALLSTVVGGLLAGVAGVAWGGLAALVARQVPRAGGPLAEVLLAPARLIAVAPLLLAAIILVAGDGWPAPIVLAVTLAARIAVAVTELDRPAPAPLRDLGRAVGGIALVAVGTGLAVLVGLGLMPFGNPATPLPDGMLGYYPVSLARPALVALVVIAPWLLAGVALTGNHRRADAIGTLQS